jgi:hypothetical protein
MKDLEIDDFGDCIVARNIPEEVDPYDMLMFCANVEHEGGGQFRFDGVYPETKTKFLTLLTEG